MSQHTPGPWHRGTRPGQRNYIFDAQGTAVVEASNHWDVDLIAAAPDLLAALIRLMGGTDGLQDARDAAAQARAAIAKAGG